MVLVFGSITLYTRVSNTRDKELPQFQHRTTAELIPELINLYQFMTSGLCGGADLRRRAEEDVVLPGEADELAARRPARGVDREPPRQRGR